MTKLLTIGGAHIDRTARLLQPHIGGASNPADYTETVGGGGYNAARIAKLRGVNDVAMISVRGGDAAGQMVEADMERQGIADYSATFMDRPTPSYTAILEPSGELVTAIADMALYDMGLERQLRRVEGRERLAAAKHLLIDSNMQPSGIERALALAQCPVFAMAISPAKAKRLLPSAKDIDTVFLNQRELFAITNDEEHFDHGAVEKLEILGFKRAVISDGADAVMLLENSSIEHLTVPPVSNLVDVTGAGDALTGATIAAYINNPNAPFRDHVLCGIAAAQMTLQVNGPLCEAIGTKAFDDALANVQKAQKS